MLVYEVEIQHGRGRKSVLITLFQRISVFSYVCTDCTWKCPPLFRVFSGARPIFELQGSGMCQGCKYVPCWFIRTDTVRYHTVSWSTWHCNRWWSCTCSQHFLFKVADNKIVIFGTRYAVEHTVHIFQITVALKQENQTAAAHSWCVVENASQFLLCWCCILSLCEYSWWRTFVSTTDGGGVLVNMLVVVP